MNNNLNMKKIFRGVAPMAGVTDWPMRVLCYRMGANYACSEMVSAMGWMCAKENNQAYKQLLYCHEEETNTACQLFGNDPVVIGEATARATALNRFTSIDINMGCPARKIVSGGDGSALLKTPELAQRIMESIKKNTHLPVTLKTRLGFDENSMNAIILAKMAEELGFAWVCFHGRTRMQQYSGVADYVAIRQLKEQLKIPVIANGDVKEPDGGLKILKETGADGYMVGRAIIGNPFLFRGLSEIENGLPLTPITNEERSKIALQHLLWMVEFKGERIGITEMRKHLSHYVSGFRGATALRRELNTLTDYQTLKSCIEYAFSNSEE